MKPEPTTGTAALEYRWVLLAEHCRRTGETPQTVHTRRKRGIWLDGKHTMLATKKRLYVNVEEYNKWIESQARLHCRPA